MTSIELLTNPGCPHADAARRLLEQCLDELGLAAPVTERVGDFPSPTVVVNGADVMGAPSARGASCRLDPPSRERILAALGASQT
ncbi:MAG TPA: alkylmercury lyase [Candidatus Dormibacteraeota bacterium]